MANITEKSVRDRLVRAMQYAHIYDSSLEMQISETAAAIVERDKMQSIVNKEGRTITEEGVKGQTKRVAHPLLAVINNFHRTITTQLSALGLNRLKRNTDGAASEDDRMQTFMR